jgi:hypothetical protein
MSKLYTFGCSFTEDFEPFYSKIVYSSRSQYIHEVLGGRIPKSWTEVLAEKMNIDFQVFGAVNCDLMFPIKLGNTNASTFYNFTRLCKEIKKNDIVIIQWTFLERFLWYNKHIESIINVLPNQYPYEDDIPKEVFEEIIYNKSNLIWYQEIYNYEQIIKELAIAKGFDVYFWSIDNRYYEYFENDIKGNKQYLIIDLIKDPFYFLAVAKQHGAKTIEDETNGKIKDSHFGEIGHQIVADLFYKHITNE